MEVAVFDNTAELDITVERFAQSIYGALAAKQQHLAGIGVGDPPPNQDFRRPHTVEFEYRHLGQRLIGEIADIKEEA